MTELERPRRLQRSRAKGYRMPEGAVYVGRPTKWGNPFRVDGEWIVWTAVALGHHADLPGRRRAAVDLHRAWLTGSPLVGLPAGDDGSVLEFSDGTSLAMEDHMRGVAGSVASRMHPPSIPPIPDIAALRGHDLVCWCPTGPCHADALIEMANS